MLQSKQILESEVSKVEKEEEKDMCKALEDLYQHGKDDKLIEQVKKKLAKKCSAKQMAEALEESVETIQQIIQNIQ